MVVAPVFEYRYIQGQERGIMAAMKIWGDDLRPQKICIYIHMPVLATKTRSVDGLNIEQQHLTIPFFFVVDTISIP